MSKEVPSPLTEWPDGIRLPIVLSFEHQSGEGAPLLPGEHPNYMIGGHMEYGGRRGLWNILEVLDLLDVKSTIFVSGTTAERHPDAVRAAHQAGHEIAGMSYGFERVRTAPPTRERAIISKTAKVLRDVSGAVISGWRCPDYRVSVNTLDILASEGFAWDSSHLNDDLPTMFDCKGGEQLVEIPFSTSTADKTFIGYPYPQRGGPQGLANVWNTEFDALYGESATAQRFMILSIQTWATGRPAPLRVLRQFIRRALDHNDVRFVQCGDIARWCAPDNATNN